VLLQRLMEKLRKITKDLRKANRSLDREYNSRPSEYEPELLTTAARLSLEANGICVCRDTERQRSLNALTASGSSTLLSYVCQSVCVPRHHCVCRWGKAISLAINLTRLHCSLLSSVPPTRRHTAGNLDYSDNNAEHL
jgi:hypothetical protein